MTLWHSLLKTRGSSTYCRLEVDVTYSRSFARHSCASRNPGFPVKTGIQFHIFLVPCLRRDKAWIPVFTGMTILMFHYSDAHGRPQSNPMRDRPTISQSLYFASRRGVSTIPEGDTKWGEGSKIVYWFEKRSISYQRLNLYGWLQEESATLELNKVLFAPFSSFPRKRESRVSCENRNPVNWEPLAKV